MPTQLQESIGWELVCRATSTTSSSRGRRSINSSSLSSSSCRATSSTSSSGRDHSHQRGRRSTNSSGVSSSSCRATSNTSSSGRNHSHQRIVIFGRRCAPDEHWKLRKYTKNCLKIKVFSIWWALEIKENIKNYMKIVIFGIWCAPDVHWKLKINTKSYMKMKFFWYLLRSDLLGDLIFGNFPPAGLRLPGLTLTWD